MLSIRDASSRDLAEALDLLKSADLPTEDVPAIFGESFAVAINDSAFVGVAGIEPHGNLGLLRSVGVRADQRGKGVGDALTQDRIAWARRSGAENLYLLTLSAAEYFVRFGFEEITRAEVPATMLATYQFAALCPDSAIVMRLKL